MSKGERGKGTNDDDWVESLCGWVSESKRRREIRDSSRVVLSFGGYQHEMSFFFLLRKSLWVFSLLFLQTSIGSTEFVGKIHECEDNLVNFQFPLNSLCPHSNTTKLEPTNWRRRAWKSCEMENLNSKSKAHLSLAARERKKDVFEGCLSYVIRLRVKYDFLTIFFTRSWTGRTQTKCFVNMISSLSLLFLGRVAIDCIMCWEIFCPHVNFTHNTQFSCSLSNNFSAHHSLLLSIFIYSYMQNCWKLKIYIYCLMIIFSWVCMGGASIIMQHIQHEVRWEKWKFLSFPFHLELEESSF